MWGFVLCGMAKNSRGGGASGVFLAPTGRDGGSGLTGLPYLFCRERWRMREL